MTRPLRAAPLALHPGAPPADDAAPRPRAFANHDVFLPAWFPTIRSRELRHRPMRLALGPVAVVLWRDGNGVAHAFSARCPHLGADLSLGRVVDGELRCALHHWRFDGDGRVTGTLQSRPAATTSTASALPDRCARTFPVYERYGMIFVYPGRSPPPPFPALPDGDDPADYRTVILPSTRLRCHHHLTTANGIDAVHLEGLHHLEAVVPWRYDVDEAQNTVHVHLHHRHRKPLLRATLGTLQGRFSAVGPSLAWVTSHTPVRGHALFCTRPEPDRGSSSRAILFVPRRRPLPALKAMAFMFTLLGEDDQMLNSLRDFHPGYVDSDAPVAAFERLLERWPRE